VTRSHCHTSVTLDDMVTVTVTKSQDTWKNIEDSKEGHYITCRTYIDLETNTWSLG